MEQEKHPANLDRLATEITLLFSEEPPQAWDSLELFRRWLASKVGEWLSRDAAQLLRLLYRVDVPEEKVREAFTGHAPDPALLIADLIITRQLEKGEARRKNTGPAPPPGEDSWL